MAFQWHPEKNASNIAKHGVDFEEAIGVFEGWFVEWEDTRKSYGERRFVVVGVVDGVVITVVCTHRGTDWRIISARRASQYERELYRAAHPPAPEEGQD